MKALLYNGPGAFAYTDVPDPFPGPSDLLVRVRACGICGSDVQGATGRTGRRIPPLIMGHEAAGVVEAAGPSVSGFAPGDRVVFDSTVYCHTCEACRQGLFNRCARRQVLGVSTPTFRRHGAFAEFVVVPYWIAIKLPDELPFGQAALLEPASIALHAANRGGVGAGETAVVLGAGTIGLFVIQAVRLRGAARVIACDTNDFRLGVARRLGADTIVNPGRENLDDVVRRETGGRGADVVIEAVGFARTVREAVSVAKAGGRVTLIGNLDRTVELDLQDLVAREVTLAGSYASSGEFGECVRALASGRIVAAPLISDVMKLSEGARAFERLLAGNEDLLKIVLEP